MPSGSGPAGTALVSSFVLAQVDVLTPNQLRVSLRGQGSLGSRFTPGSVLDPGSWDVEALDPDAAPRLVQTVTAITQPPDPIVDVFTDAVMTFDRQYRLQFLTAFAIVGCDSVDFGALRPQVSETTRGVQLARDGFRDIANPNLRGDAVTLGALALGTYVIDADGDLRQDEGKTGLRKRVIRRLTTAVGGFFHLPEYGVDLELKRLITPDRAVRIAARARAQLLQEPDVAAARVQVTNPQTAPNVIGLLVTVRSTAGEDLGVQVQLDPQGRIS